MNRLLYKYRIDTYQGNVGNRITYLEHMVYIDINVDELWWVLHGVNIIIHIKLK
jgi:hypothetical protein